MKQTKYFKSTIILCLSVLLILSWRAELKDIFYQTLVYCNFMRPCYKADKNPLAVFEQEGFNYWTEDQKVIQNGLKKLANRKVTETFKIPAISHHIYFTSTKKPKPLNVFYEEKLKSSFRKLNLSNKNWTHFIWTNLPEIIPNDIMHIDGVQIKNIKEFNSHPLYNHLYEAVLKGDKLKPYFSEGADLLRFMALQKYGGMYNDMDYEIYNADELIKLLKEFDFVGGRETVKKFSYYASAFLASKPNHPIINEIIKTAQRNYSNSSNLPDYIKYPCSEHARIYANAPPLVTMSYFAKNNLEGNDDIILPTWVIMNATFARYKNKDCKYDKVTHNEFVERESHLNNYLTTYPLVAKEEGIKDSNIYYSIKDRALYPVVGADMFCGGWSTESKKIKKRKFYWNF